MDNRSLGGRFFSWFSNGISGLLWPLRFKQDIRKRVILGYRNHQKRQRISLKPDKSKSSFEVKDILPHLRIWEINFSGSWCTYLIRSWAENMKSLWKRSAKRKKRKITLRFQRLFMFSVQLFLKYQYVFPQNSIFHFLLWGKISSTACTETRF